MQESNSNLIQEICAKSPELETHDVERLVHALPGDGIRRFPRRDLPRIIRGMRSLQTDHPVHFIVDRKDTMEGREISLYVIGFDHDLLFSILVGVLAAAGMNIREGTIATSRNIGGRRIIIDHFSGNIQGDGGMHGWVARVEEHIREFYQLLESPAPPGANPVQPASIQQRVIELVSQRIQNSVPGNGTLLNPIHLKIIQKEHSTVIEVKSSDTPFFLYSLSTVLNLHRLRIEHVHIETRNGRLVDIIEFTDRKGKPIKSERVLNRIKLSILISKQFTYFLDKAPDPAKALERFDSLIQDVQQLDAAEDFRELLASSGFHGELARLLGTSDFLWEDFIRIQRDSIVPMLKNLDKRHLLSTAEEELEKRLSDRLDEARGPDANSPDISSMTAALNEFKNRESFLIDMDHITIRDLDFFFLSRRLSALAEAVVRAACRLAWLEMTGRYGIPRSAGGLEAEWAVFGLGKLGGKALGYASDLELLFVFSDNGHSDGEKSIANRDFFEKMFKRAGGMISAKKEGIFQVDLRLRPHGEDGPVAVKLDKFSEYFRAGGKAHSAERLALVRMRHLGGSPDLGRECLSIRNHILYESDAIIVPELRDLRQLQLREKLREGRINAKFSPGGLVDLEYNVQILQVIHGRKHESLRGPGIHDALKSLHNLGTIDDAETEAMIQAYRFHRNLINGLRMLRGNAEDLFLPPHHDREYRHLARRIGYKTREGLSEADQLTIDFETHSARVRQFVERHLGREAIPGRRKLTIVDIVISDGLDPEEMDEFFRISGFQNGQKAMVNIQNIAQRDVSGEHFIRLAILAWERISRSADPDMALNNWEQFTARLKSQERHFTQLLSQPKRMDILFSLLASSQFLADTLIQNPGFFFWATDPEVVSRPRNQIEMEEDLSREALAASDHHDWLNRLRRQRKKEILRIGVRDIALGVKIEEIMGEISFLARSCCEIALREAAFREIHPPGGRGDPRLKEMLSSLSVLAFGKLGGWELNYSSDIDLLCVYLPDDSRERDEELKLYTGIFKSMVKSLNDFTREGQAYRVDMRLRPYGASGPLVSSMPAILEYYRKHADPWEFQALIKLKPVAGSLALGERLLSELKPEFDRVWDEQDPRSNIDSMRKKSIAHHVGGSGSNPAENGDDLLPGFDVKNDHGGIRDIEFFIQGMQMLHSGEYPVILTGNSLRGLQLLERTELISGNVSDTLAEYYTFFRRVEHYLQLSNNKQAHSLSEQTQELTKLALCLKPSWKPERFFRYFKTAIGEVHSTYSGFIRGE